MDDTKDGNEKNGKRAPSAPRVTRDLRNMRLAGSERGLSQVIGNLVAGRLGPSGQSKIFDALFSEVPQQNKRAEMIDAIAHAGLSYDLAAGLARQKDRDAAYEAFVAKRRSGDGRLMIPNSNSETP